MVRSCPITGGCGQMVGVVYEWVGVVKCNFIIPFWLIYLVGGVVYVMLGVVYLIMWVWSIAAR